MRCKGCGEQARVVALALPPNDENRAANLPKHPSQVAGLCRKLLQTAQACSSTFRLLVRRSLTVARSHDVSLALAWSRPAAYLCAGSSTRSLHLREQVERLESQAREAAEDCDALRRDVARLQADLERARAAGALPARASARVGRTRARAPRS